MLQGYNPATTPAKVSRRFSVAPMMEGTDKAATVRPLRYFVFTFCSLSDTPLLHRFTTWQMTGLKKAKKDWTH